MNLLVFISLITNSKTREIYKIENIDKNILFFKLNNSNNTKNEQMQSKKIINLNSFRLCDKIYKYGKYYNNEGGK